MLSFPLQNLPNTSYARCTAGFSIVLHYMGKCEANWNLRNRFISQLISILTEYLVKIGSSQYFFSSPKTSLRFLLHPREKPFLSGPFRNVGARNVSVREKPVTYFKAVSNQGGGLNRIKVLHCENRLRKAIERYKILISVAEIPTSKKKKSHLKNAVAGTSDTSPQVTCLRWSLTFRKYWHPLQFYYLGKVHQCFHFYCSAFKCHLLIPRFTYSTGFKNILSDL